MACNIKFHNECLKCVYIKVCSEEMPCVLCYDDDEKPYCREGKPHGKETKQ